jgi:hypothetical protein
MNMGLLNSVYGFINFVVGQQQPPQPQQQQRQTARPLPPVPKRQSPRLVKTKTDSMSHTPPVKEQRPPSQGPRIEKTVSFKESPEKETTPEDINTQINHIKSIQKKIQDKFKSDLCLRLSQAKRKGLVNALPDTTVVNRKSFITDKEFNMLCHLCNRYKHDLNKKFKNDQGVKDLIEKIQSNDRSICLEDLSRLVNHLFHYLNSEKLTKS